mgnify:CR=1 FL=1
MKKIIFVALFLVACGEAPVVQEPKIVEKEVVEEEDIEVNFEVPPVMCTIAVPGIPPVVIVVAPEQVEAMEQNPYVNCE